ncbi:MAG: hypothetical protein ACRDJU_03625 [Actinomycetota bacterium]
MPTNLKDVPLPPGFDQAYQLVGDPNGSGVWFLSEAGTTSLQPHILHWNSATSSLQSWQLPTTEGLGGSLNGIAVDAGGAVWAGLGDQLFELTSPDAPSVSPAIPLPDVGDATLAEASLPSPAVAYIQAHHPVTAIASDGQGDVAIGRQDADSIQIFHSASHSFESVPLPAGTTESSLAFDADGVVAAGLIDAVHQTADATLFLGKSGFSQVFDVPVSAIHVDQSGTSFIVSDPAEGVVSRVADTATAASPVVPAALPVAASEADGASPGADLVSTGQYSVYPTDSGLAVASTGGGLSLFRFPTYDCASKAGGFPVGNGPCKAVATAVTVDKAGNIWYESSGPGYPIGYIPPSSYGA